LEISPWQVFVGQADDGVVVVSSSDAQLRASLPSSEAFLGLGLHQEGPGSFGFTRTVVPEEWRAAFAGVESLSGSLGLGDVVTASVSLQMASASGADELRAQATSLLTTAQAIAALQPGASAFALREVLARAQLSGAGVSGVGGSGASGDVAGRQVQFQTFWQLGEVDHIAEELGAALERRMQ
jgi:hypothetical protein